MIDHRQYIRQDYNLRDHICAKYNLQPNDVRYDMLVEAWHEDGNIQEKMPYNTQAARNFFIGWCKYEVNRKNAFKQYGQTTTNGQWNDVLAAANNNLNQKG